MSVYIVYNGGGESKFTMTGAELHGDKLQYTLTAVRNGSSDNFLLSAHYSQHLTSRNTTTLATKCQNWHFTDIFRRRNEIWNGVLFVRWRNVIVNEQWPLRDKCFNHARRVRFIAQALLQVPVVSADNKALTTVSFPRGHQAVAIIHVLLYSLRNSRRRQHLCSALGAAFVSLNLRNDSTLRIVIAFYVRSTAGAISAQHRTLNALISSTRW